jgi:hypothetical protein
MSVNLLHHVLGLDCVAIGAGVGAIASAGAATTSSSAGAGAAGSTKANRGGGYPALARRLREVRRVAAGTLTVATKNGFVTVTFDNGAVQSVSGQQLTLLEGTKTTHRTATLTIPTGAVVRDDGEPAPLGALKAGQRAVVITAPNHTYVIARTPRK